MLVSRPNNLFVYCPVVAIIITFITYLFNNNQIVNNNKYNNYKNNNN